MYNDLNKNGHNAGFTLIEMLVTLALSSIMFVMMYTTYSAIVKSIKDGGMISDYYANINTVIRRIDADILNAY